MEGDRFDCSVTVVVTVLNEKNAVGGILDGILAQSYKPDEIVVVDGGSSDGTTEFLHGYSRTHSEVRVFVAPGSNISEGRNVAIRHASSDLIAVTDAGCKPHKEWLKEAHPTTCRR